MRKLTFLIPIILTALMSGCSLTNIDNGGKVHVLISSIKIEKAEVGQNPVVWSFGYGERNALTPNTSGEFRSSPYLVEQKIVYGDEPGRSIKYRYPNLSHIVAETTVGNETLVDSLKLDYNYMAVQSYENNKPVPYYIEYTTAGYRSKVYDLAIVSGSDPIILNYTYTAAKTIDGDVVATYEYTNHHNELQIQQFGIYGSEYYWNTRFFGKQSDRLLSRMTRIENQKEVVYDYSYTFYDGRVMMVEKETITRDGEKFMTNTYDYMTATERY